MVKVVAPVLLALFALASPADAGIADIGRCHRVTVTLEPVGQQPGFTTCPPPQQ